MDEMHFRVAAIAIAMAAFIVMHRLYVRWRFNARKDQMRDLATRNKWQYTSEKTGVENCLNESRIMKYLGELHFQSVIEPPADECKVWISDLYPAIGNAYYGGGTSTKGGTSLRLPYINRTVFVMEDSELALPHFFLKPETAVTDQFYKAVGDQDVNFDEDSVFSEAFILQGKNEEQTRGLFDHKVRGALVYYAAEDLLVEGLGKYILLYQDRLQPVDKIEPLLQKLKEIRKIFRARNYTPQMAKIESDPE